MLTVVHAAELADFDAKTFAAINGDAGGTWAPSSAITIGGAGLVVSSFAHFTANVAIDGTLAVNSLAQFTADVIIGTSSANYLHTNATATFNSPAIFSSTLTANGFAHFTANVAIDGTLAVNSLASFSAGISVTGTALVTGASTLAGVTCSTLAASGDVTLSGTGSIVERVAIGAAANTTYSVSTADSILILNTLTVGSYVYTLDHVGAVSGKRMHISIELGSSATTEIDLIDIVAGRIIPVSTRIKNAASNYTSVTVEFVSGSWRMIAHSNEF